MRRSLTQIRDVISGTAFEGDVWLVGGSVRDELLGRPLKADIDLVTRGSSAELANLLYRAGLSTVKPVTYERFGTAMVRIDQEQIEIVTARKESYESASRKPNVEPATILEDAQRRDFTVNALLKNLSTGELLDPLEIGLADLRQGILRTPLDPRATFHDDPLRMLRAVRFRWQLGFNPAAGLYEAIGQEAERLSIISAERIRDEFVKILGLPTAPEALQDLLNLGLLDQFAPEFRAMVGVEQGSYHHLDVWNHTLLVVRNAGNHDPIVTLGALFHDIGKPPTQSIDSSGNIRFFSHESVGARMTEEIMRRLKFPGRDIEAVTKLVRNHMRLGSAPEFTPSAARRLLRDLGEETDRLLALVEADANGLKRGVRVLDLTSIRKRLQEVRVVTPKETLQSPLSGVEIMELLNIPAGPEVGVWKGKLLEKVLEGELQPGDKEAAKRLLITTD